VIQLRTLAPRELQVLQCLAGDYSEKETAEELGISAHAVKVYVGRIREKFGVHKMTTAVAIAFRQGWLK
jgi:DNA-binding CsgD family transcriptional regulator